MTKEEKEAINNIKVFIRSIRSDLTEESEDNQKLANDIETLLSMLKEKDAEIEKKDNAIKKIINRLDNDIKRITETKRDRSTFPNYLDDYTKCRLKAYKTKTKEIKEYIKKQYFERKIR